MNTRRDFVLANIAGLGLSTFIGNVIEASPEDVNRFGKPKLTLEKKKTPKKTQVTIETTCLRCQDVQNCDLDWLRSLVLPPKERISFINRIG